MIKNLFLPTDQNQNVPFILSRAALALYFLLALVLILGPNYLRYRELASLQQIIPFDKEGVISLINEARLSFGKSVLVENEKLDRAAEKKALDMLDEQYFSHVSPDKKTPWSFLAEEKYAYQTAGENLAIDFLTAQEAHEALMESPTHRANILSPLYTQIGTAVVRGVFEGKSSIIIVQFFGKPKQSTHKPITKTENKPQTTPVAAITPNNATNTPPTTKVLSATQPKKTADDVTQPKNQTQISQILSLIPYKIQVRIVSWFVILTVILSLAFLVLRLGSVSRGIIFRSIAILAIFGVIIWFGGGELTLSKITPIADSVALPF